MQVIDEYETLIDTHFITDGERLSAGQAHDVKRVLVEALRSLHIVVGVHFVDEPIAKTIGLVLECRPGKRELEAFRARVREVLAPLPTRPAVTTAVRVKEVVALPNGRGVRVS